jgi:hypothetical protein
LSIFKKIADKLLSDKSKPDSGGELSPIENASDMSPDEKRLISYIRDKVDDCRHSGSRIAYEAIWLTNIAYLLGFSGVSYDPVQKQYKNADPSNKMMRRSRMRVNKILPTIQNRLARLCKSPPEYDVRPNSNSTEDKDAARLALQIIENVFDKTRFEEKRQELLMTTQQFGYAFIQVCWDPNIGKCMYDPETNEMQGYEGDIRIDVLNPFEVFTDPLAKRMEDVNWWIKAKVRKLSYFQERYPERGDAVKEEDAWLLSSQYEQRINALTASGITGSSVHQQMKNSAIEIVYYEKRSKEHPNGRMIVTASGILLEDKELPIGEFDLTKFDDIVVAGKFQSESVITHLRPIQDQYNLVINKRAEWVRKMLAGKYIVPRGAGLEQEAINNESGEIVHYNVVPNAPNGGQPIPMMIPNMPSYAYNEEKALDLQFDFVSGLSEISRGQLPFAGIPAEGMQMLQEADETRVGIMTARNELGYAQIARHILLYASEYYKMPRILKIAGDGLEYTVKEFVGADIKDNHDVIVLPGSTIPGSKTLRRQEIINAYQLGILGPVGDPKTLQKLAKMIEFGDQFEIWKPLALDSAQIKKSLDAIEQGTFDMQKDLHELDNHIMYIQEMNDYRKTDKYTELGDKKQALFDYVLEWHIQAQVRILNPGLPMQQQLAEHMVKSLHDLPQAQQPAVDQMGNPQAQPPSAPPSLQQTPPPGGPPMGGPAGQAMAI